MVRIETTNDSWLQRGERAVTSVAHDVGEKIRVGEAYAGRVWAADEDATLHRAYRAGMAF